MASLISMYMAAAQQGVVRGLLKDTSSSEALQNATVSVLHPRDSSVIAYSVANAKGQFEVTIPDTGSYRLVISHEGYRPVSRRIRITARVPLVNLGVIVMEKRSVTLEEVVVEGPPIQIKKDTIEFNASAFKVKPNSTAEDMLKKLPGVQVDKDGSVKAQGEDIQKVYVDGKEFFGTDPKLATKNITSDMIESIQVYDDMSDQAKFTRVDDGSRQKTINIKLKKNRRKGYFGRATLGYGSGDRYDNSLSAFRFDNDRRISVLGAFNNVNKQGFSFSDVVTSMGGFARGGGGGGGRGGMGKVLSSIGSSANNSGITKTLSTGINYSDKWGSKVDVTGSYFFSRTNNTTQSASLTQSFFPNDSSTFMSEQAIANNINQNHRANMRIEYYLDSANSILYTPSVVLQHSEGSSYTLDSTQASSPSSKYLAIVGAYQNSTVRDGVNLNNNLLYRRKFKRVGRTLTFGWNNTINNSNGHGSNLSPLTFFQASGGVDTVKTQNIENTQSTHGNNNLLSASYTEPLSNNSLLELNYAYTDNYNTSDRKAFNFDSVSAKYDNINLQQTNYFENSFRAHRGGLNFRQQTKKYNFQLGGGVQWSELSSRSVRGLTGKDTTLSQKALNFFPTANFNYNFNRTKHFRFSYRGRTNQPSVSQLQDVPDVSNPLQIRTGNPDLKQEFANTVNINYNSFNPASFKFISFNINLGNTSNKIVNSIDSLRKGVQIIRPVNLDGAMNGSAFVTLGFPLKGSLKGSNFNFNSSASYNRDVSQLYKQKNYTNTFVLTQTAGINLAIREELNLGLNASLAYNSVKYTGATLLTQDQQYYTQTYSSDISYTMFKSWILSTDFDYYINTGRTDGFNQAIPLWNASLAKQVFKKKNGEFRFSVRDILNQNRSITRTVADNYIQDSRNVVLQRYFLLTFAYNLNKTGADNKPNSMPPGVMRRAGDRMISPEQIQQRQARE